MEYYSSFLKLVLASTLLQMVSCWDSEDLEIFDLVEEVNINFYQLLQVPEDSNATEIKKAFRKLSLVVHPDKNDAPDADIQFRQLAAVYEVLKDNNKRSKYDLVLKNGLPNWHEAVYYYRRVRKMGLLEMMIILFVIVTLGQYIVCWAAYLEKKYVAEQNMNSKAKKIQKKQKKSKAEAIVSTEPVIEIPPPSMYDILPVQIVRLLWFCIRTLPTCYQMARDYWEEWRRFLGDEDLLDDEEEEDDTGVKKRARRRKVFELPEMTEDGMGTSNEKEENCDACSEESSLKPAQSRTAPVSGGLWTDDDLIELIKQIKRFPQGTLDRWEKIAYAMNRLVPEVTFMARKVKEEGYRVNAVPGIIPTSAEGSAEGEEWQLEKPRKVKTKGGKLGKTLQETSGDGQMKETSNADEDMGKSTGASSVVASNSHTPEVLWSQVEQKALENALLKYPKGTLERWDKIAKCVPGKRKEDCMLRYKLLVELVKKRKESQEKSPTVENSKSIIQSSEEKSQTDENNSGGLYATT
ncbi:dnaJ homolog subfamily C member 1-like [Ischnura elegans]|uniref:dnaJ homolog subfamily C member 1-like n=1 Tax=Ischnura elegans TaxID=197161 RepID=UPI001ED8A549|nr:dnaJ homolog subfamily C member 1-like [Ischnura elegans]